MTRKVKIDLKTTWDCREVLVDGKLFAALTAKAQRRNTALAGKFTAVVPAGIDLSVTGFASARP